MYVSDAVRDDYTKWGPGDTVIINAQTGSGKTHFVLNKLLPFVSGKGERLLYLSNRSALKEQVMLSYPPEYKSSIEIMNYQSFEQANLNIANSSSLGASILSCAYWIMDEAHYFLSDGFFNGNVSECLFQINAFKRNRVLIFMTATVEYLLLAMGQVSFFDKKPPVEIYSADVSSPYGRSGLLMQMSSPTNLLKYKESCNYECESYDSYLKSLEAYQKQPDDWFLQEQLNNHYRHKDIIPHDKFQRHYQKFIDYFQNLKHKAKFYQSGNGYSHLRTVYFKTLIQLCREIKKTSEEEKWVIFVSSKSRGETIKSYFEMEGIDCVLITAETKCHKTKLGIRKPKDYEAYQCIIKKERSPVQVTISTAVLDNGVNLKDKALKHIAILEMNPTTFLQMLGRKRVDNTKECLNLYLEAKDIGEVKAYFIRSILIYVKFLVELQTVNSWADSATKKDDMKTIGALKLFEQQYQVNGHFRTPFNNYVSKIGSQNCLPKDALYWEPYICRYFRPNPVTSARLMYDYYRMLALLETFENTPDEQKAAAKEIFWIKHQLSWLGLQYDESHWIDFQQHKAAKKKLRWFLNKNNEKPLSKNLQRRLKRILITVVNTSHPAMNIKIGRASLKKVNEALEELGFPQKIESKNRSIGGKQRNYWMITSNDETNTR